MTRKKANRGKPGPKPGFQPAVNLRRQAERQIREAAKLEAITTGALTRMTEPTNGVGLLAILGLTAPSLDWRTDPALLALTAKVRKDPLCRSKELRSLNGGELKAYARGLHVPQHDVDGLTDDRLRQNCLHKVAEILEAITE